MSKYRSNQFNKTNDVIKGLSKLGDFNSSLFELSIFSRMENFIKVICLKIYSNNILHHKLSQQNDIMCSYLDLLDQLGMLEIVDGENRIKESYLTDERLRRKLEADYNYVVNNYYDRKHKFKTRLNKYLLSLIEYLLVLEGIKLDKQIEPALSDSFYSDLGSQAFELFNKKNFSKVVREIKPSSVLDIGCGNGNFIDYFIKQDGITTITGIELQSDLAKSLKVKYQNQKNINVYSENILKLTFKEEFDFINISYMLFYLSYQEQISLFSKLANNLSDKGRIVICQYFGNIEDLQIEVSKKYKKWKFIDRYKFSISQNVLYSELLLNSSIKSFDTLPQYDKFINVLNITGFEIKEVYPADDNFYSFYFIVGRK